jgi:hypothetical protein
MGARRFFLKGKTAGAKKGERNREKGDRKNGERQKTE